MSYDMPCVCKNLKRNVKSRCNNPLYNGHLKENFKTFLVCNSELKTVIESFFVLVFTWELQICAYFFIVVSSQKWIKYENYKIRNHHNSRSWL